MDHSRAPLLEALADYHRLDRYGFTPPAHRQGRGIDPRVREIMGLDPFRDDVLASAGLDDRSAVNRRGIFERIWNVSEQESLTLNPRAGRLVNLDGG